MPRFFFHVHDGLNQPDLQGTELPNLHAARMQAVQYSGALLIEQYETFWKSGEWKMRVTDGDDLTLFELLFVATESAATG